MMCVMQANFRAIKIIDRAEVILDIKPPQPRDGDILKDGKLFIESCIAITAGEIESDICAR